MCVDVFHLEDAMKTKLDTIELRVMGEMSFI